MQNRIPVLSADDQPLTPCRPHRARQLVAQGKARRRHMEGIPYIHLTRRTRAESRVLFDYELNIDPGTSTSGYAIALTYPGGHRIITALYERHHDAHKISKQLAKRASYRRTRRGRLHYRKPTGLLEHKPEGWLAPSQRHLLEQHQRMIDALCALYPVGKIRIETGAFDPHLMQNPDLHGVEYQRGTLHGTQLRAYIRHRDGYCCAYCGKRVERLELDHIVPESKGGPTRPGNLVLACRRCNQRKGNRTLEEFLAGDPERLRRIVRQADTISYRAAAHMNATLPSVLAHARSKGVRLQETDAATTSWNRRRFEVDKRHSYDAALLGSDFETVGRLPEMVAALQNNAKASKQKAKVNGFGTPGRSKNIRNDIPQLPGIVQRKYGRKWRWTEIPQQNGKTKLKLQVMVKGGRFADRETVYQGDTWAAYCRLSPRERNRQYRAAGIPPPWHSGKEKRHGPQGIGAGDLVEIEHSKAGILRGIASVKDRGTRVALRGTKPSVSARMANTRLIRRRPAVLVKYEAPSQTRPNRPSDSEETGA